MTDEILQKLIKITGGDDEPCVLATVVSADASTPREAGARMIVRTDGSISGTVGGGAIEKLVIDDSLNLMKTSMKTKLETYSLGISGENQTETGMLCGGKMVVFMESFGDRERLFIYGCGHIGVELAALAARCDFSVTAIDHRSEFATAARFPDSVKIITRQPGEYAASVTHRKTDYIVIVTHGHRYDAEVLFEILKSEVQPRYIGMIGSRRKITATMKSMGEKGIPDDRIQTVMAPVGLNISGESPAEITVSILAEILAVRGNRLKNGRVSNMKSGS